MRVRPLAVLVLVAGLVSPAISSAQVAPIAASPSIPQLVSLTSAELRGVVLDERGQPLARRRDFRTRRHDRVRGVGPQWPLHASQSCRQGHISFALICKGMCRREGGSSR